jgi:hypothetical protein
VRRLGGLLAIPLLAIIVLARGGAVDHEYAQAGKPPPGTARIEQPNRYYQGLSAREWADRAVYNRKRIIFHRRNSEARGRTIARLKTTLARGFIPGYWVAVASCESGVDWAYNGSSGFDGAVQFHPGTWTANRLNGYPAYAYQATPFQQLVVAEIVLAHSGWGQWPACSRKLGLR